MSGPVLFKCHCAAAGWMCQRFVAASTPTPWHVEADALLADYHGADRYGRAVYEPRDLDWHLEPDELVP